MLTSYRVHIGSTTDLLCCRALEGVNCEAGPGSLPESIGIFLLPRLGGGSLLHKGPEKNDILRKGPNSTDLSICVNYCVVILRAIRVILKDEGSVTRTKASRSPPFLRP